MVALSPQGIFPMNSQSHSSQYTIESAYYKNQQLNDGLYSTLPVRR
jgi:hypothetical protein